MTLPVTLSSPAWALTPLYRDLQQSIHDRLLHTWDSITAPCALCGAFPGVACFEQETAHRLQRQAHSMTLDKLHDQELLKASSGGHPPFSAAVETLAARAVIALVTYTPLPYRGVLVDCPACDAVPGDPCVPAQVGRRTTKTTGNAVLTGSMMAETAGPDLYTPLHYSRNSRVSTALERLRAVADQDLLSP